ncbi:MAG: 30S ribosome-binding factor RbfA [Sulfurimonas sp.]|uniref:30S ribosome-binding factor RbfA n=1 Tax=Sulfurimonas sp. TaxID=2022749 RepID=UPI0028CD2D40|nr:30S ribosome-binding factor RbfA [Sulfurimonas sp.]MDT8338380.1 30S ribosome-binding factor RbfA [Sulfurimonas sp.]
MTEAQIKLKRTESLLLELIPEAIGSLNDKRLHELNIIDIKCSRGRSDAKVYIDPVSYSAQEKSEFLKLLKNARPIIETFCMKEQGWFRSPSLTFEFDEQLKKVQNIEELFKKIAKE